VARIDFAPRIDNGNHWLVHVVGSVIAHLRGASGFLRFENNSFSFDGVTISAELKRRE
jgi:hypothetical protein